eukprot:scaffold73164_cov69-Phaeocystis_antarctica.AAC.6
MEAGTDAYIEDRAARRRSGTGQRTRVYHTGSAGTHAMRGANSTMRSTTSSTTSSKGPSPSGFAVATPSTADRA